MNMSFYTGATGARQQQFRMQIVGNNVANVNTYGYKAHRAAFYRLMHADMPSLEEGVVRGTGSRVEKASIDFTNMGFLETGRTFDFAINGSGFFAMYDLDSQEITFTRDGSFVMAQFLVPPDEDAEPEIDPITGEAMEPQFTEVWRLSDNYGRCVLDSMGNFITIDPEDLDAELDLGVYDYLVYDGLRSSETSGKGFQATEKSGNLYLGSGTVQRGYLEVSNVDLAVEFTKMIESQRAYSFALRMITVSDEVEQTINGLST